MHITGYPPPQVLPVVQVPRVEKHHPSPLEEREWPACITPPVLFQKEHLQMPGVWESGTGDADH